MNRIPVDKPRPMHLGAKTARLYRRIIIGPVLYLRSRLCLEHEDATQSRIFLERPSNHKFVFGIKLPDVGHVCFLQLFTCLFA